MSTTTLTYTPLGAGRQRIGVSFAGGGSAAKVTGPIAVPVPCTIVGVRQLLGSGSNSTALATAICYTTDGNTGSPSAVASSGLASAKGALGATADPVVITRSPIHLDFGLDAAGTGDSVEAELELVPGVLT